MLKRKPKVLTPEQVEEIRTKDFFDMILPGTIKFLSDHYIVGDSYRCVWAIREYPPSTEEQAILSQLADRNGVTLRIYHRLVESMEQRKIIQNATRRNRLKSGGNDVNETIEAEGNLQDVIELLANLRKNKEPLLHVSVFIELKARSMEKLKELQSDIAMELTRSKISVDRLTLRQKEGFLSVLPVGANQFGAQYERVLPASSVANMYPFNFSGKTDPHGSYVGRDKYGTNILVDFDRRAEDKTTSNKAAVLDNPSTEGFFKIFSQYTAFASEVEPAYSGYAFPRFDNFTVTDRYPSASPMKSSALGDEQLRATFTDNSKEGEGLFAASVVDFGSFTISNGNVVGYQLQAVDGGYYMAYNIVAVTAAKDTFIEWEGVLTDCFKTLQYSDSFVSTTNQASNEKVALAQQISQNFNATMDGFMSSWESRNRSQDIMSQKQSDATLGYERVYDTETNEIYKATNGFTDVYDGKRYKPVTDDNMYAEPISGYIEKQ